MDVNSFIDRFLGGSKLTNEEIGEVIGFYITAKDRSEDDAIEILNYALFFVLKYFKGDEALKDKRDKFLKFFKDSLKEAEKKNYVPDDVEF